MLLTAVGVGGTIVGVGDISSGCTGMVEMAVLTITGVLPTGEVGEAVGLEPSEQAVKSAIMATINRVLIICFLPIEFKNSYINFKSQIYHKVDKLGEDYTIV